MENRKIEAFDLNAHKEEKVSIYGATVGGKVVYQQLRKMQITVEYIYDKGKIGLKFCDKIVRDPELIKKNELVINVLTRSFDSAYNFLRLKGCRILEISNLVSHLELSDLQYNKEEQEDILNYLNEYSFYASETNDILLPVLEVFITEKCTLQCKHCSHMIPLYQQPKNYSVDEVIQDLQKVLAIVQKVHDLSILGGEPLLHPELHKLISWASEQDKIEQVSIISNATVIPIKRNLEVIKENNVRMRFSDYGELSGKLERLVAICKENKIPYFINQEEWIDMGTTKRHFYTEEKLKQMFMDCPFVHDYILLKGRLYRCAHIAHLVDLGIVQNVENDYVDFRTEMQYDVLKERLYYYLKEIDMLDSCVYCNGINLNRKIQSAIQVDRP